MADQNHQGVVDGVAAVTRSLLRLSDWRAVAQDRAEWIIELSANKL